jgi:hypothetical protein
MADNSVVETDQDLLVRTPHARVLGGVTVGLFLLASAMAVTDPDLPDVCLGPLGWAIGSVLVVLFVRILRMGVVVGENDLLVRG